MISWVIIAISTCTHACFSHHSQWNNWIIWNQDETADVNQVKTMKSRLSCRPSESSGKLWIKWTSISTAVRMFPPRWEYFHRGDNVPTAVRMFPPRWKCFHRGGNYFHRGDNYFHMCVLLWARMRVRFRVCACVHACVGAWVRVCVHACMRVILLLWSAVAQWENAGLAIEIEVFESPLIPFRSLGIFFLFTMPQFTQLYKWVLVYRQWWTCEWIVVAQLLHG